MSESQLAAVARKTNAGVVAPITDTDVANARRLHQRFGSDIKFTAERGWLVWNGKRWVPDEKSVVVQGLARDTALGIFDEIKDAGDREAVWRHAKHSQSRKAIEAMVALVRSEPGVLARITDFDRDPLLFNVENGTIDLRTGELQEHRREDLMTMMAPVRFDPDAGFDLWDAFLWRILNQDDELYRHLQRLAGYLLTGVTVEQLLYVFWGSGANGKSVLCEVLMALMGDYAIVVSPDLIMTRRHTGIPNDVARLRGARAAFMNETGAGARFDEAKLKDLTGGDRLSGRFLHAEFFDFTPTHKLIVRGNHKPRVHGTDEGIWRRLRLVPFTVTIPPEERDNNLLEKLRAELPGILNWCIAGALAWQREGLKSPAIVADAVQQYRAESDTLGRFLEEECAPGDLAKIQSSKLFAAYQRWCERAGERWIASKDLPAEMEHRGYKWHRTNRGCVFLGIELAAKAESENV